MGQGDVHPPGQPDQLQCSPNQAVPEVRHRCSSVCFSTVPALIVSHAHGTPLQVLGGKWFWVEVCMVGFKYLVCLSLQSLRQVGVLELASGC